MKITINTTNQSLLGKNKYNAIKEKIQLRGYILNIIEKLIKDKSLQTLNEVEIFPFNVEHPINGEVKRCFIDNNPHTKLLLSDMVIMYLKSRNPQRGMHIINHELCHIMDFETICTKMDGSLLCSKDNPTVDSTFDLHFTNGYKFFGEYIAYRNCYNTYVPPYNEADILLLSEKANDALILFSKTYSEDNYYKNLMFNETDNNVYPYIYLLCKLIGYFHASNDESFIIDFNKINNTKINCYIKTLDSKLKEYYQTYPKWISKETYTELGKLFFILFNNYGIYAYDKNDNTVGFDIR